MIIYFSIRLEAESAQFGASSAIGAISAIQRNSAQCAQVGAFGAIRRNQRNSGHSAQCSAVGAVRVFPVQSAHFQRIRRRQRMAMLWSLCPRTLEI